MNYASHVQPAPRAGKRAALVDRITDLAPAVRKVFEVRPGPEERAAWMSLTVHQLEALTALAGGSITMRELCERLDISESAGTALCDRLVGHGMVVREQDPSDRRVVRLSLSRKARAMVDRFRRLKRKRVAEVLSVLDDAELETLAGIYEHLLGREASDRRVARSQPEASDLSGRAPWAASVRGGAR